MKLQQLVASFVLLFGLASSGLCQEQASEIATPLEIRGLSDRTTGGSTAATVTLANASEKAVAGFVLVASAPSPRTGRPRQIVRAQLRAVEDPGNDGYDPGAEFQVRFQVPPDFAVGSPDTQVSLDYVLFVDGSGWGPDTTHRSLELKGVIRGSKLARAVLKRKLQTEGPDAVLEALK